jgi:hypothetical protein
MKRPRPQSYRFGPYVVRQDAGQSRRWRVFAESVEVFQHDSLAEAMRFARRTPTGGPVNTTARKYNRFARSGGQSGIITCRLCGKHTRETGEGEGSIELCSQVVENVLDAWAREPGWSVRAFSDAFSRAAHEGAWTRPEAAERMEALAGELVLVPTATLPVGLAAEEGRTA